MGYVMPRARHPGYTRGRRSGIGEGPAYAALDLGTNNCRLLVALAADEGFRVIDSFSRITRLGEGLQASGRLSEAAIDRTIAALKICAGKLRRHDLRRARFVATEACRGAVNCEAFVERVVDQTGIGLEIITAKEEACLAARGCGPLLVPERRYALVFDIGGGSTEVTWLRVADDGSAGEVIDSLSMPWGVVRMAEAFGGAEVNHETYELMIAVIRDLLSHFERRYKIRDHMAQNRVQMIGTSGTVTTIAGVHLGLERYQRDKVDGRLLKFCDIRMVVEKLNSLSLEQRCAHPCIGPDRADLVLPGCAIMDAILREWPVGRLRVADRGLREGILFNLIAADHSRRPPCQ